MEVAIINQLVDLIIELGINPFILISVIFITTGLKKIDKKNKFKPGYVLFPLIASLITVIIFTYANNEFIIAFVIKDVLIHASLGAYAYDIYNKIINKQSKSIEGPPIPPPDKEEEHE